MNWRLPDRLVTGAVPAEHASTFGDPNCLNRHGFDAASL
jgi:hypothetical protein